MEEEILVFQDENADYCVIVGTSDRAKAEAALRKREDEWFGPVEKRHANDEMEKPMNFDDFSAATIYSGKRKGEDVYYWGNESPSTYFDDGKYETEDGFIAALN